MDDFELSVDAILQLPLRNTKTNRPTIARMPATVQLAGSIGFAQDNQKRTALELNGWRKPDLDIERLMLLMRPGLVIDGFNRREAQKFLSASILLKI